MIRSQKIQASGATTTKTMQREEGTRKKREQEKIKLGMMESRGKLAKERKGAV